MGENGGGCPPYRPYRGAGDNDIGDGDGTPFAKGKGNDGKGKDRGPRPPSQFFSGGEGDETPFAKGKGNDSKGKNSGPCPPSQFSSSPPFDGKGAGKSKKGPGLPVFSGEDHIPNRLPFFSDDEDDPPWKGKGKGKGKGKAPLKGQGPPHADDTDDDGCWQQLIQMFRRSWQQRPPRPQ